VPTVRLKLLRSMVPLVCVNVRVEPIVRASSKRKVPPTPLKVSGKFSVFPLVRMVRGVALVEANVVAAVPAVNVMPVDSVKSPNMLRATLLSVPEKPVKLRLLTLLPLRVSE